MDYGEGIVWQQALLIPGDRMYASIDAYPFIVFHYTPVYHLFARLIAHLGLDNLTSGRLLSLASMLSIAIVIGLLTFRLRGVAVMSHGYRRSHFHGGPRLYLVASHAGGHACRRIKPCGRVLGCALDKSTCITLLGKRGLRACSLHKTKLDCGAASVAIGHASSQAQAGLICSRSFGLWSRRESIVPTVSPLPRKA
jgi:hypothetical protein